MKKIKLVGSYFFEFVMAIALFLLVSCCIAKGTIFQESYVVKRFEKASYYENLSSSIQEKMSHYIVQSGLSEEVLENLFTKEDIKKQMTSFLHSFYSDQEITIDSSSVKERLEKNITDYLAKNNIKVSDEKELDTFVSKMIEIYEENMTFSNNIQIVGSYIQKGSSWMKWGILGSAVLFFISFLYLELIAKKRRFSPSFFTTGILLIACFFFGQDAFPIENAIFYTKELSKVVQFLFFDILNLFRNIGIFFLFLGIFVIFLNSFFQKEQKKGKKK